MQNIHSNGIKRRKISTMPRKTTEASEQLELYKMVTKRQRIQQEMHLMGKQMELLTQQLNILNTQIENTEKSIQNFRQSTNPNSTLCSTEPKPTPSSTQRAPEPKSDAKSNNFQTFHLEY